MDPMQQDSSLDAWSDFATAITSSMRWRTWAGWSTAKSADSISTSAGSSDDEASPVFHPRDAAEWRPKALPLLAALRIAKTFGSASGLSKALNTHRIVLLTTGSGALDRAVVRVIEHITSTDGLWPSSTRRPVVLLEAEASRTGPRNPTQLVASLSERARDAIEQGMPFVVVAPIVSATPQILRDLHPMVLTLAPISKDVLLTLLEVAFPGENASDELVRLADLTELSRLSSDQITLALRASDPVAALKMFREFLTPQPREGLGLAEFPMPRMVREQIGQLITDLIDWQAGRLLWRDVSRGVLLVGPPGVGKTQLARLIAEEAGVTVVGGSLAQWSAEGGRGSEVIKAMRATFALAAERAPSILFIDELDAFGDRTRSPDHNSAYTDYVVAALLDVMDGFGAHEGVVMLGAANHLAKLDRAIVRPGRFDQVLFLGKLELNLIPSAIRWHLGKDLPDADLSELSKGAVGMSGAEIALAVRSARAKSRRGRRDLLLEDVALALEEILPPLPPALRERVAVHESGHAIVAVATGCAQPTTLAINSGGGFTSATQAIGGEDRDTLERYLAVDLAGRAAETLIFGSPSAGAGGNSESDLANATQIAAAMEGSLGLGTRLLWLGPAVSIIDKLQTDFFLRGAIEAHLCRAEGIAIEILEANIELLEEMAGALDEADILAGSDLEEFTKRVVTYTQKESLFSGEPGGKLDRVPRVSKFGIVNHVHAALRDVKRGSSS